MAETGDLLNDFEEVQKDSVSSTEMAEEDRYGGSGEVDLMGGFGSDMPSQSDAAKVDNLMDFGMGSPETQVVPETTVTESTPPREFEGIGEEPVKPVVEEQPESVAATEGDGLMGLPGAVAVANLLKNVDPRDDSIFSSTQVEPDTRFVEDVPQPASESGRKPDTASASNGAETRVEEGNDAGMVGSSESSSSSSEEESSETSADDEEDASSEKSYTGASDSEEEKSDDEQMQAENDQEPEKDKMGGNIETQNNSAAVTGLEQEELAEDTVETVEDQDDKAGIAGDSLEEDSLEEAIAHDSLEDSDGSEDGVHDQALDDETSQPLLQEVTYMDDHQEDQDGEMQLKEGQTVDTNSDETGHLEFAVNRDQPTDGKPDPLEESTKVVKVIDGSNLFENVDTDTDIQDEDEKVIQSIQTDEQNEEPDVPGIDPSAAGHEDSTSSQESSGNLTQEVASIESQSPNVSEDENSPSSDESSGEVSDSESDGEGELELDTEVLIPDTAWDTSPLVASPTQKRSRLSSVPEEEEVEPSKEVQSDSYVVQAIEEQAADSFEIEGLVETLPGSEEVVTDEATKEELCGGGVEESGFLVEDSQAIEDSSVLQVCPPVDLGEALLPGYSYDAHTIQTPDSCQEECGNTFAEAVEDSGENYFGDQDDVLLEENVMEDHKTVQSDEIKEVEFEKIVQNLVTPVEMAQVSLEPQEERVLEDDKDSEIEYDDEAKDLEVEKETFVEEIDTSQKEIVEKLNFSPSGLVESVPEGKFFEIGAIEHTDRERNNDVVQGYLETYVDAETKKPKEEEVETGESQLVVEREEEVVDEGSEDILSNLQDNMSGLMKEVNQLERDISPVIDKAGIEFILEQDNEELQPVHVPEVLEQDDSKDLHLEQLKTAEEISGPTSLLETDVRGEEAEPRNEMKNYEVKEEPLITGTDLAVAESQVVDLPREAESVCKSEGFQSAQKEESLDIGEAVVPSSTGEGELVSGGAYRSGVVILKLTLTQVLELVYWKDVKKTGVVFGTMMFILISLACFTLLSVLAYLSLAILTVTFTFRVYKNVMQAVQKTSDGHPFKNLMEMEIELNDEVVKKAADNIARHVNNCSRELRRLYLVGDYVDSLKFGLLLWVLTYIGAWFNGMTLVILAVVSIFTLPKVYDTYKVQIDSYINMARAQLNKIMAQITSKIPFPKKKAKTQ